jgi:hypothetical protein
MSSAEDSLTKEVTVKAKSNLPADFMKGYTRDIVVTGKFVSALAKAMAAYPSMRVGQLLYNAITYSELPQPTSAQEALKRLESFHSVLFNIYDERLIEALEKFTALKTEAKDNK